MTPNDKLSLLEKKLGQIQSGSAGPEKLGTPAHMVGSNVMQTQSDESHMAEPKLTPEEHEFPASDDHNKDSTNLPTNEGKRPKADAVTAGRSIADIEKGPASNLAGGALGGLAGMALGGPLGAIAGAALGHRMQHAPTNVTGQKVPAKAPKAEGEEAKPGLPEKAGGAVGRAVNAYREARSPKPASKPMNTDEKARHLTQVSGGIKGRKLGDEPVQVTKADREEAAQGVPVFLVPKGGKMHLYEANKSIQDQASKGLAFYKGLPGMAGGAGLGYLVAGPIGALAGGVAGDKLADAEGGEDETYLVYPHEDKEHVYSLEDHDHPEDDEEMQKGLAGAAAGAYMGYLVGGPLGAIAGAYLGHKVQGSANPKPQEAVTKDESVAEAEDRRKGQADENMGGGLEQKPVNPHAIMDDMAKKFGGDRTLGHTAAIVKSGRNFIEVYDRRCFDCRVLMTQVRKPAAYFKSLAKAIDTGIVALGALSPSDITRFHKDHRSLDRVFRTNEREA